MPSRDIFTTSTHSAKYQFSRLQNLPSCSINIQSFQKLPKICSTWSLWCKENETAEGEQTAGHFNPACDQSTSQSSATLTRVPPKLPRHHRKMPFRRRAWCGCFQVRKKKICCFECFFFATLTFGPGLEGTRIVSHNNISPLSAILKRK